jgi:hypothetical protein
MLTKHMRTAMNHRVFYFADVVKQQGLLQFMSKVLVSESVSDMEIKACLEILNCR